MAYNYYKIRKEKGLCGMCGKNKPEQGKAMCEACNIKNRANVQKQKQIRRELGLCPTCGQVELWGDEKNCPECRAMILNSTERTREKYKGRYVEKQRESAKIRYRKRLEDGICVICGKRPLIYNRTFCYICQQKAHRRYLQKKGLVNN